MTDNLNDAMISDDIEYKFCQLFFSKDYGTDENKKKIIELVEQREREGKKHFSYSVLSGYIFDNAVEDLHIKDKCDELTGLFEAHNEFIEKTIEDIKLAYCQKEYIKNNVDKINDDIEKIDKSKGRIYSEFVALLGIFTAIAFSIFGGLDVLSSLFSKLEFSRPVITLGFVLVTGSVTAIIIYGIIIVLMDSIYKLTNVSNHQEKTPYPISKNLNNWILIILFVMFVVGLLLLEQFNLSKVPVYIFAIIGIIAVIAVIAVVIKLCQCCKSKAGKS